MPRRRKITLDEVLAAAEGSCFVAMDFSTKYNHVFDEVYAPAISNAGLIPIRSDTVLSAAGNVVDEIVRIIQAVRIVLVDITGLNANVLVELGIAQALRRPTVLLTQDGTVPFDIQPKRVIHYELSGPGRRRVRAELLLTIKAAVFPAEVGLRAMFPLQPGAGVTVLHGSASDTHIASVHPPVEANYRDRLQSYSSETSGLWDISVALQRIANSRSLEGFRVSAADGNRVPPEVIERVNTICLGGPGANRMFKVVESRMRDHYDHVVSIQPFAALEDKRRYRVTLDGQPTPADQDELLSQGVDFGILVRLTVGEGRFVWLAAGVRSFGTEGAIRALTTPSLINEMFAQLGDVQAECVEFGAIVRTSFDPQTLDVLDVSIERCQVLRRPQQRV